MLARQVLEQTGRRWGVPFRFAHLSKHASRSTTWRDWRKTLRLSDFRCEDHNWPPQLTDSRGWTTDVGGWAFGDNSRNRYCSINSRKIRTFKSLDDALEAIYRQQQKKRRRERYQVIYRIGLEEHEVSTEDEIAAIDARIASKEAEDARIRIAQEAQFSKDYPELDTLRSRLGPSVAFALSSFLARWRQDGFESAASSLGISRSTAYRYKKLLHESDVDCP